jgi:hypothetical protein
VRSTLQLAWLPAFLTLALVAALVTLPGRTEVILNVYLLLLAAAGLTALHARLRASLPVPSSSPVDEALRPRAQQQARVPELERIEREVAIGLTTAFDLHFRLRPTVRRIAAELLHARRGVDLDASPDAARQALGEETWQLVREDREPPPERFAPGLELASLRRVVDSLEAL